MHPFRFILAFLLLVPGSATWAQTGMTVFGNCSVAEKTSIVISDEQLTLEGDIMGNGQVIMAGVDTQTVVSRDRTVGRLVVANRKAVKIRGKLTVQRALTIKKGNLVVEPASEIVVMPEVLVTRAAGCHVIGPAGVVRPEKDAESSPGPPTKAWGRVMETGVSFEPQTVKKTSSGAFRYPLDAYQGPDILVWELPPWKDKNGPDCDVEGTIQSKSRIHPAAV